MQKEVVKISEQESFSAVLSVRRHWDWQKIWLLLKRRFNLSTQSTTLWALLLISTKTIVNAVLLTTNLNKLNITGSYGLSRKYGFTTLAAWLLRCNLRSKGRGHKEQCIQCSGALCFSCPQTALNIKQESSCFVSAMDPHFIASWRINWAGCYLLAHNVSRYTLGQTFHQCFQEFHKLTIKSNPQRISILCATLWKVLLRVTDATSFCTSQNFLYWIKNNNNNKKDYIRDLGYCFCTSLSGRKNQGWVSVERTTRWPAHCLHTAVLVISNDILFFSFFGGKDFSKGLKISANSGKPFIL